MKSYKRPLGHSPARRSTRMELHELEERYLAHHRALGHSEKTVIHYRNTFLCFDRFLADVPQADELSGAAMNAFASWLRATPTKGWRGDTNRSEFGIHGLLKDMRAFLNWLVEEEILEKAPKVPVPKLPQTLFPILSDAELARVFGTRQLDPKSEIGIRNRALIAFLLDTGVRRAEVAALTTGDITLQDGMAKVSGKGRKERIVFFAPATAKLLKSWLAIRGDGDGPFFWLSPDGIHMLFRRIQKEAGLEVFHPHQLRHTAATKLLAGGADTHSVRRMLGHSSVVVTEKYLSLSTADLKAKHAASSPYERLSGQLEPTPIRGKRRLKTA